MPAVARRIDRSNLDVIRPNQLAVTKTTTYSMTSRDLVVYASTAGGAWTLTLPPVHEAAGKTYLIKLTAGAGAGAAPNALNIQSKSYDAIRWTGPYMLWRPGNSITLLSDGEEWLVISFNLGKQLLRKKGFYERFDMPPNMYGVTTAAVSGVTGDVNVLATASGNVFLHNVKVTQTLLGPIWLNPGLNIAQDLTDNDGVEYTTSLTANSGNPTSFVVGTDPAFFCRARVTLADVSGTDDFWVGFRKQEAFQAAANGYADYYSLGLDNATGDINTESEVAGAGALSTDTTLNWADGETHTLEIRVSGAGVVTAYVDDVIAASADAYTFTAALTVVPYIFLLHATTSPGAVNVLEWECGYQA
jgi:hypothetical protein